MTQKELAYVEDSIGHEKNIVKILDDSINNLESDELKEFLENEMTLHQEREKKLTSLLEEKANEWSTYNG